MIDAGEIKAAHLPAAIGPHQCRGGQQRLAIAVYQSDGDALTRLHIAGGTAQGGAAVAKKGCGIEIIDIDEGLGIDIDNEGIAGAVAGNIHGIDLKLVLAIGQSLRQLILPVTGGIHRQDGEHAAVKAQGHGGAGLPLPLQQRGIVTGQIIGLAGAGVALIGEIQGNGGDGI